MKTLIVYYSLTGNTEIVANELATELNAALRKVEDLKKHSVLWYYFFGSIKALMGVTEEIKPVDFSLDGYDRIFIGSPVWAGSCAPAINTFLNAADFKGKSVVTFVTMGGENPAKSLIKMGERIKSKGGKIVYAFSLQAKNKKDITSKAKEIAKQF